MEHGIIQISSVEALIGMNSWNPIYPDFFTDFFSIDINNTFNVGGTSYNVASLLE